MPQTKDFTTRLPPHVHRELRKLIDGLPRHFRQPSASDMVGALILRARRAPEGLIDDVGIYFDVKDAWEADGLETLPDV